MKVAPKISIARILFLSFGEMNSSLSSELISISINFKYSGAHNAPGQLLLFWITLYTVRSRRFIIEKALREMLWQQLVHLPASIAQIHWRLPQKATAGEATTTVFRFYAYALDPPKMPPYDKDIIRSLLVSFVLICFKWSYYKRQFYGAAILGKGDFKETCDENFISRIRYDIVVIIQQPWRSCARLQISVRRYIHCSSQKAKTKRRRTSVRFVCCRHAPTFPSPGRFGTLVILRYELNIFHYDTDKVIKPRREVERCLTRS